MHPNATTTQPVYQDSSALRRIAAVIIIVASTLGIASALHLTGQVNGSPPFDADHAGIAEAVIGAVLLVGAVVMLRVPARTRSAGLATTAFAIVGFIVGLSYTLRGGHLADIAYHLVGLPLLAGCWVGVARARH